MNLEILPQRRTLRVEPGANLLEALLANDVAISHSCRAGRCGTCRCRLIAGEVADAGDECQPADAAPRHLLACRTILSGPCVIEVVETDEPIFHPARIIKATVVAIDDLTHDIRRLRLRPSKPLSFSPGQYAQLQFTPEHIRPYSMAGLCTDDELEFHVRLVPGGLVTGHVASALKVGDSVRVSGPLGSAYLRRKHDGPMLCVSGGTGLAPILSIIRGARAARMTNPIHLYFGVRSTRDVYGQSWIERLTSEAPNLHVQVVVATGAEDSGHRSGPVTDAVAHDWPRLDGWRAYLCGAPPMVEAASTLVQRAGIAPDRIHADAFYAHAP